nr:HAMP domain-containing sensor histidine kinase [uncultured Blautia sp.]
MDKRRNKRMIIFLGSLAVVLLGTLYTAFRWIDTVYTEKQELLGRLILAAPDSTGEYTSIVEGKTEIDSQKALVAGREAEARHGYSGRFTAFPSSIFSFLPVPLLTAVFFVLLLAFLILYQKKLQSLAELKIFELKDKTAQLEEENNLLRSQIEREAAETKTLVTDISHQLKTPLASLKMCYEIADTSSFTKEEQRSFLMQGKNEVTKLENLTKSLVQLSRLETNMIRLEPVKASLKNTIQGAVSSVYMKAYLKHMTLSVNEFRDEEIIQDPRWTQEALVNVLDNAVKYSAPDSAIDIRVDPMVSYFLIEIEDEGIGIPREERGQIFKRFYRGRTSFVQEVDGSGVGLYLTRKILEEQGGSICVKNGKKGSTFQITFPKTQYKTC